MRGRRPLRKGARAAMARARRTPRAAMHRSFVASTRHRRSSRARPVCRATTVRRTRSGRAVSTISGTSAARAAIASIPRRASRSWRRRDQTALCSTCHKNVANKTYRFNHMPVREGAMNCGSCHNVHGSTNVKLLRAGTTVDESCTSCHADKRGPYLWEHAPVSEACTTCHDPHGSNNDRMLVSKQPFLCQRCHVTSRHPPTVYDGLSAEQLAERQQDFRTIVHGVPPARARLELPVRENAPAVGEEDVMRSQSPDHWSAAVPRPPAGAGATAGCSAGVVRVHGDRGRGRAVHGDGRRRSQVRTIP